MKFTRKIMLQTLAVVLVGSAGAAQAEGWERGCAARYLPREPYRDLGRYAYEEYVPGRYVSWAADSWVDRGDRRSYESDPRAYAYDSRYAPDPYAPDGGAYARYQPRRAEPAAEDYRYGERVAAYEDEIRPGDYVPVYPAHGDARYGDEYAYVAADKYPVYPRGRRGMIKKQAAYFPDRVYTSPQSAIVDKRSSAPYRGTGAAWSDNGG